MNYGELFIPSDELIKIPTLEDHIRRFKALLRDMLEDHTMRIPPAIVLVRQFESELTNAEIDAIESDMNTFLEAYDEIIPENRKEAE